MKFANRLLSASLAFLFVFALLSSNSFATVHIINFAGISFSPSSLDVAVGDTIIWNGDFVNHQIENTHGMIPAGAATFGPSTSASTFLAYVVTVPGNYAYQCNFHVSLGMVGTFTATTAGAPNPSAASTASLEKNYPNPFTGKTTLRYDLNRPSHVSVSIFDLNGKKISTPVSAFENAGSHEISFDASGLAGGTYIYQLQAGDVILQHQMLLIKQ